MDFTNVNRSLSFLADFLVKDVCNAWELDSLNAMDEIESLPPSELSQDVSIPLCVAKLTKDEIHHMAKSAVVTLLADLNIISQNLAQTANDSPTTAAKFNTI